MEQEFIIYGLNINIGNCNIQNNIIPPSIYSRAAGILSTNNTNIFDCIIRNNSAADYVGGIYNGSVSNCKFYNNFPSGYQPTQASTIGFNNLFDGNFIGMYVPVSAVINNSIFINNNSSIILFLNSLNSEVNNSIFYNNGSPVEFGNNGPQSYSEVLIQYCNLEGGQSSALNNMHIFWSGNLGNNNIDLVPQFVDSANGDYTLVSGSPGVDAGNPDLEARGILWQNDPEDQTLMVLELI